MRVPIRRGGSKTNIVPDPHITVAKKAELEANLDRLKRISRPPAIEEVQRLALMGDFSENAAYQIAKGRLRGINQRIIEIENHLKASIVIAADDYCDTVCIGCRVTVSDGQQEKDYVILGSSETDPSRNIISHNSPLGLALLGKRVGEDATLKLPSGQRRLVVIKIESM